MGRTPTKPTPGVASVRPATPGVVSSPNPEHFVLKVWLGAAARALVPQQRGDTTFHVAAMLALNGEATTGNRCTLVGLPKSLGISRRTLERRLAELIERGWFVRTKPPGRDTKAEYQAIVPAEFSSAMSEPDGGGRSDERDAASSASMTPDSGGRSADGGGDFLRQNSGFSPPDSGTSSATSERDRDHPLRTSSPLRHGPAPSVSTDRAWPDEPPPDFEDEPPPDDEPLDDRHEPVNGWPLPPDVVAAHASSARAAIRSGSSKRKAEETR